MAKRVSESSTSSTCLPCAAKNSATVVAASAARMRISGDWSEVETTTTERANPSSPSESSQKLAHLAAALAHQAHHRHIGLGVARHHADQRAFAHARPAEDAHPLAPAHGQQRVDARGCRCPAASRIGTRSSGERTAPSSGSVFASGRRRPRRSARPAHSAPAPSAPAPPRSRACTPSAATGSPKRIPSVVSTGIDSTFDPRNPITSARCGGPVLVLDLAALAHRGQRARRLDGLAHRLEHLPAPAPGLPRSSRAK
jgi:hypothetical protein